jgi:hypothetical protein
MKNSFIVILLMGLSASAQQVLPQKFWQLGRVSVLGISKDSKVSFTKDNT